MPSIMNLGTPPRTVITEASSPIRTSQIPPHFRHLTQYFRESYLTAEYCMLPLQPKLGGIYVIPAAQKPNLWFGVLFVHYGYYQGGIFRFVMRFPDDFPDSGLLPTVTFHPPVLHPQIHPVKGIFDLKRYFKSGWSKQGNHVWQVLKVIRSSFYKIDPSHPVDRTAADLFENDVNSFAHKAKQEVELSKHRMYEEPSEAFKDPHYIKFTEYNPQVHDTIRAKVMKPYFNPHKTTVLHDESLKKGLSFLNIG